MHVHTYIQTHTHAYVTHIKEGEREKTHKVDHGLGPAEAGLVGTMLFIVG